MKLEKKAWTRFVFILIAEGSYPSVSNGERLRDMFRSAFGKSLAVVKNGITMGIPRGGDQRQGGGGQRRTKLSFTSARFLERSLEWRKLHRKKI